MWAQNTCIGCSGTRATCNSCHSPQLSDFEGPCFGVPPVSLSIDFLGHLLATSSIWICGLFESFFLSLALVSFLALVRLLLVRLPGYRVVRRSVFGTFFEAVPSSFCLCWQVGNVDSSQARFGNKPRGPKHMPQVRQRRSLYWSGVRTLCYLFNVQCVWAAPQGLHSAVAFAEEIASKLPEQSRFASFAGNIEEPEAEVSTGDALQVDLPSHRAPKHCVIYQAGFPVQHLLVYARIPCTVATFIQDAADLKRDSAKEHFLVATRPQICDGIASLVAVPQWAQSSDKTVYVLDFSYWQGPVFAVFTWKHVTIASLAAAARRYAPGPWQVDHHSLAGPLSDGQAVQAAPGDVFTFREADAPCKIGCLLDHMTQDGALWDPSPPVIPGERQSHQWLAMRSHVTRTPLYPGTSLAELQSIAAEAFDTETDDLEFEFIGRDSTLQELVYEGSSVRGVLAAEPKSLSGKRHNAFVFLDARLIGRQPSFRFCTPGWTKFRDLFDYTDFPEAPAGYRVVVQGVTSHGDKVLIYDGCTVVIRFLAQGFVAASGQLSHSHHGHAVDSNTAGRVHSDLEPHGPQRFEREDPPSPDPEHLLQANPREAEIDTLTELVSAWFLVFAPRFQHESYQLEITVPCTLDHALAELAEQRDSGCSEFFTELIPAFPQPDASFGAVIAVPPWAEEQSCVLIDARAFDNRLFSTVFRGRLNRKAILLHLQIPDGDEWDLYCGRSLLTDEVWRNFLPGETVAVRRRGDIQAPPISLVDMLRAGSDWAPQVISFPGPHFPAFCVLSDGGYKVILVDVDVIKSFSDFKKLSAETFQHRSGHVNVCSSVPRVSDLAVNGQNCKAILVATEAVHRIQIPPGRLELLRTIVFLDCRLLLRAFSWVAADQGRLDVDLLIAAHSDGLPAGYGLNIKGANTELRAGHTFFQVPNGTLLTFTLVETHLSSSATSVQESEADSDSDDSSAPDDDDAGSSHDAADDEPAGKPPSRAHSRSRSPLRGDVDAYGETFSKSVALLCGGTSTGWAASKYNILRDYGGATAGLSLTVDCAAYLLNRFWSSEQVPPFGSVKGIVSAKILDEPPATTPFLEAAVAFLRYTAPRLDGGWRYNVPADAQHIVPDSDEESSEGTAEEPSTLHFLVLSPGYLSKHVVIQLRLPVTINEALRGIQAARRATEVERFPSLIPANPQPCPGSGVCLALPAWHAAGSSPRVFLCLDTSAIDGRIFTRASPEYVSRRHLLHLAALSGDNVVDVHTGDDPVPLGDEGQLHVEAGDTFIFVPPGTVVPTLHSLAIDLFSGQAWSRALTAPVLSSDGNYCLVHEADSVLYTTSFLQPTAFRQHIAACVGISLQRLRIFPSFPRVTDATIDGFPCRTVIAVSELSVTADATSFGMPGLLFRVGKPSLLLQEGYLASA